MWRVSARELSMAEGDHGIALPITFTGITFAPGDEVRIVFARGLNEEPILVKSYQSTEIENNTIELIFSEEDSARFPVGGCLYGVDYYHEGEFMCNLIPFASFTVVDKVWR